MVLGMFYIHSSSSVGLDADLGWMAKVVGSVICTHCRDVKRESYPQGIDVVLRDSPRALPFYGVLFRVGLPLYRSTFVQQFPSEFRRFAIGRVLTVDGGVISEYVSAYSRTSVLLRGDDRVTTKVCPLCSSVWSDLVMVFPDRPAYLLRHQLTNAQLHQGRGSELYITEELAAQVEWSQFPDVQLLRVDVRNTPLDRKRLPGDPDWVASGARDDS